MDSVIWIGTPGNLKRVWVLWPGYTNPELPSEHVSVNLAGEIQNTSGTRRKTFRGQFEVSDAFPASYADVFFLKSLHKDIDPIQIQDHTGLTTSVVWTGPFKENWVDQGANLVRIPFELIEVT